MEIENVKIPMSVPGAKEVPKKNFLEIACSYCAGKNFVKRGLRKKSKEIVQLYFCRDCQRTFTPGSSKGKHYPLSVILDAISLYDLGYSLEEAARLASKILERNSRPAPEIDSSFENKGQKGTKGAISDGTDSQSAGNVGIGTATLLAWLKQYEPLCAFARMRPFAIKMFSPKEIISSATLAHRQLYRFRHHRAKTILIIQEDWKHSRFWPLKEFLDLVPAECPHQYFAEGMRASEAPIMFSKTEMIVRGKNNFANKMAKFVLQSVEASKDRHDALQRFMLANDSVTVATEVPIYLRREDLTHMQTQLGFKLFKKQTREDKGKEIEELAASELPKLITGHIDFVQIRNGQIHILDYKPNAAKERPIEQLTIYALALSRLTGLKVFNFKCAWFDEKDYFEFYPLHVVYKPDKKRRRKNIKTIEGSYVINENAKRMDNIRPAIPLPNFSNVAGHPAPEVDSSSESKGQIGTSGAISDGIDSQSEGNFGRPAPEISISSESKGQAGTRGATSDGTDSQSEDNFGSGTVSIGKKKTADGIEILPDALARQ